MSKENSIPVVDEEAGDPTGIVREAEAKREDAGLDAPPAGAEPETPVDGAAATDADEAAYGEPEPDGAPDEPVLEPMELQVELAAVRLELEASAEEMLRVRAEMENVRRRSARDVENAHKYGVERLISELLPVKDSMELGITAAGEAGADIAKVREGQDLTLKMLASALEKFAVEEVNPLGERFDPEFHQAMSIQPTAEAEPDTVVTVFQKGYTLAGRLVRPAMVVVARAPGEA